MVTEPTNTAAEIAKECARLEARASAAGLALLAYLLNVAAEEATARAAEKQERKQ